MKYKDFEDYLMMEHAKDFIGTKDVMVDAFNDWLENLDIDDFLRYGDLYAIEKANQSLDNISGEAKNL